MNAAGHPTCKYCDTEADSAEHQLFHCFALDDPNRRELISKLKDTDNYIFELVSEGNVNGELHSLFYNRVQFIDSINIHV